MPTEKANVYAANSMIGILSSKQFISKAKFAVTSSVATLLDHALFLLLVYSGLIPGLSNLISQFSGMTANFFLQKQYIFALKRKAAVAFLYSLAFSAAGLFIGSGLVQLLVMIPLLAKYPYIAKVIVTGLIFFYNYYTKRFAFEKR